MKINQIVKCLVLLSATGIIAMTPSASGTVLLSDTFNTANNADINVNLARQTGTLAGTPYVATTGLLGKYSINANTLFVNTAGNVAVSPNYNFTALNNYSISVMFKPVTGDERFSLIIGAPAASEGSPNLTYGTGTMIQISATANQSTIKDKSSGTSVNQTLVGGGTTFTRPAADASGYYTLRLDINTSGSDILTGNATVNAYVQGVLMSTFTRSSAYTTNYISLFTSNGQTSGQWDNLQITSTVPEPSSACLLGLGGLCVAFWRRVRWANRIE